ncbi:hypothetical protein [Aestuariimicrobium sp. Y1814]|uniref:hypothetical protein n=1 Tax=Aestuariimicrobium sp. Y1814 TaxID=3418742 RepID=UPI003DA6EA8D
MTRAIERVPTAGHEPPELQPIPPPVLVWKLDPDRYLNDPDYAERVRAFVTRCYPATASPEAEVYDDPTCPTGRVLITTAFIGPTGQVWIPSREIFVPIDPEEPLP